MYTSTSKYSNFMRLFLDGAEIPFVRMEDDLRVVTTDRLIGGRRYQIFYERNISELIRQLRKL